MKYSFNWIGNQIKLIWSVLRKIEDVEGGGIKTLQEGENITIDNSDPKNPKISSEGGDYITVKGNATQSNAPTPYDAVTYPNGLFETYIVRIPLTMPNSWGSAVTQAELDANFVYFDVKNGVVSKNLSKKPEIEPFTNTGIKVITDWNYPYKNTPISELQIKTALAIDEIFIKDYDNNFNYYLIQVLRNVDMTAFGYSGNEYAIKVVKQNKSDLTTEVWKIGFGNNEPIEKIPSKLEFEDKFTVLIDWTKFPEFQSFDVDPSPIYLLSEKVGKIENSPKTLNSINYKENNNGKNIFLYGAGKNATENGEYNLGIGKEVFENIDTAGYNLAIGYRAMKSHQVGAGNIAIGMDALLNSESVVDCTIIGWEASKATVSGVGDTALGRRALGQTLKAGGNTALGDSTLYSIKYNSVNGDGGSNVAIGYTSGEYCATLKNSILIGLACARNVVGGTANVILGSQAMLNRTANSNSNIAIGENVMLSANGNENVVIGAYTMNNNSGNENVVIGYNAGNSLTNGARNVFLGNSVGSGGTNVSDSIGIGNNVKPTKDNQVMIGDSNNVEFVICGVVFTKAQIVALKALV